jgi:uncharacterized membrane protein (UPF0127 family)
VRPRTLTAAALAPLGVVGALIPAAYSFSRASFVWHEVAIAGERHCLPVAYSAAAQERGLQGVKHVARPMVFAFSAPSMPSFWVKVTPSPLTGVWVGSTRRVIGYWHGRPESTTFHTPPAPVSDVIEYPAGAKVPALGSRVTIGRACRTRDRRL